MNETFTLKLTSDLHQLKDVENYLIIISAVYKLQIIQFKMRHWPYPSSSRAPMLYNFFFVPLDTPRQSAHSIFTDNYFVGILYHTNFLKQLIHLELNSSLIFIPVTSSPSKKEDIWCILKGVVSSSLKKQPNTNISYRYNIVLSSLCRGIIRSC